MSDFQAIGAVSATLKTLLKDRMELPNNAPVPVTIGPPAFSPHDNEPREEDSRVNLFLYRVSENGYLQNQEIPGRGGSSGYGHPPLSVNLHYLVTAYGNKAVNGGPLYDETTAQFLLGSAMRVLHDIPVVTDGLTTVRAPIGEQVLHKSLRDSYEQVKVTLEPLTLEDITKVWTALTLRYRLSAAYAVNVVQIESRRRHTFPRPVGEPASPITFPPATDQISAGPHVFVVTIQTPTISHIWVRRDTDTTEHRFPYARIDDTLVVYGTSLSGPITSVAFGDLVLEADPSRVRPDRIEIVLPDNPLLQPGVQTMKVITNDPATARRSFSSSEAPFVLVPRVQTGALTDGPPRTLTITGRRLIPTGAGGEAVIGRLTVPRADYLSASTTQITVPVPVSLPARDVRVLVGDALADPVPIGDGPYDLSVTIGADTFAAPTPKFSTSTIPRDRVSPIVEGLIRAAAPTDERLAGAVVSLAGNRLVVIAGDLRAPITLTSPGDSTLAEDLKLTAPQPVGAPFAAISGHIGAAPLLTSTKPRLRVRIGAQSPIDVSPTSLRSLADFATDIQADLNAAPQDEYRQARVLAADGRLIVIPGTAATVVFEPAPGDQTTVAELQLHANFVVRVRVNGAESIDGVTVELPR